MLRKQVMQVNQVTIADSSLPLIIHTTEESDFTSALSILEKHPHPLRGIVASQQFLETNKSIIPPFVTYIRIHVSNPDTITLLLKSLALKKRLLEVFIPIQLIQSNPALLETCEQAHRIVIEMQHQHDLIHYTKIYSQFLLMSKYPLFSGAPFCAIPPEHCYEFFDQNNTQIPPKPAACADCLFIKHCPFKGKEFTPNPLTNTQKYNDALTFLNPERTQQHPQKENVIKNQTQHENTPARF
ncbi:hypothetical protein HYV86_03005 [Candidatus Woesearchaeota archaeon]|nr:hypothetical protein [Candidatus Woesearchaeota archaeon]